jgi:hypothetical protein
VAFVVPLFRDRKWLGAHDCGVLQPRDSRRRKQNAPGDCPGRLAKLLARSFAFGSGYWIDRSQYIPPIPPPGGAAGAGFSSFFSTTTASVVSRRPAIEAAFCSAVRVTLVGSMTPALTRSS